MTFTNHDYDTSKKSKKRTYAGSLILVIYSESFKKAQHCLYCPVVKLGADTEVRVATNPMPETIQKHLKNSLGKFSH